MAKNGSFRHEQARNLDPAAWQNHTRQAQNLGADAGITGGNAGHRASGPVADRAGKNGPENGPPAAHGRKPSALRS